MPPQIAPAVMPMRSPTGSSSCTGRKFQKIITQAVPIAPQINWPSAPMFQKRSRKAIATPRPVRVSGIAFTSVSVKPAQLPNAPLAM